MNFSKNVKYVPMIKSWIYPGLIPLHLFANTRVEFTKFPKQRKARPILACVENKVYVLACSTPFQYNIVEPSFEEFDAETNSWNILTSPPFNEFCQEDVAWWPTGYVVYKDYIIFCVLRCSNSSRNRKDTNAFWSYHTPTGDWKKVNTTRRANSYSHWSGEAHVIGGVIYGYADKDNLVAYYFSEIESGLLLDRETKVSGWVPYDWGNEIESFYDPYYDIGKIGDRLLCYISSDISGYEHNDVQPVGISFHYIDGINCRNLGSYCYLLHPEDEFFLATTCRMLLKLGGDQGDDNGLGRMKRAAGYKHDNGDDNVSDVKMMESNSLETHVQ